MYKFHSANHYPMSLNNSCPVDGCLLVLHTEVTFLTSPPTDCPGSPPPSPHPPIPVRLFNVKQCFMPGHSRDPWWLIPSELGPGSGLHNLLGPHWCQLVMDVVLDINFCGPGGWINNTERDLAGGERRCTATGKKCLVSSRLVRPWMVSGIGFVVWEMWHYQLHRMCVKMKICMWRLSWETGKVINIARNFLNAVIGG